MSIQQVIAQCLRPLKDVVANRTGAEAVEGTPRRIAFRRTQEGHALR